MEVPDGFTVIEPFLYRARNAPEYAFDFLRSLKLKTIVVLDSGTPNRSLSTFAQENNVKLEHLVTEAWRPIHDNQQQRITAQVVSKALKFVLDSRNYPVIVLGSNLLTGTIRKLENWSLFSVLNDYNMYSEGGAQPNPLGSVFLEFATFVYGSIDMLATDEYQINDDPQRFLIYVDLPEKQFRPEWTRRFNIGQDHKT